MTVGFVKDIDRVRCAGLIGRLSNTQVDALLINQIARDLFGLYHVNGGGKKQKKER
jgi:hypothetical protein